MFEVAATKSVSTGVWQRLSLCLVAIGFFGCSQSKSPDPSATNQVGGSAINSDLTGYEEQTEEQAAELAASRDFISFSSAYTNAASDLLDNVKNSQKEDIRYFSLIHLYNSGASDGDLEAVRQGLSKALNSLSRNDVVKKPEPVDNLKLVFRIRLGHYDWDAKDWDMLVRGYPYLIIPKEDTALGVLQADTGSAVPIINADWFIATAMIPPLYYALQKAPDTLAGFEKKVGVNMLENIKNKNIMRAAFDNSQVAPENRVIERHKTSDGFLWRSYEFDTSDGRQNVLDNPLGPTVAGENGPFGGLAFLHEGTEIVYIRPNGMIGFFVAGKSNQRINEAPGADDKLTPVGAGCMACHARGFLVRDEMDMVLDELEENSSLKPARSTIEDIFPGNKAIKRQLEGDIEEYLEVLEELGVDTNKKDPISRVSERFNNDLTKLRAASELGISQEDFESYLGKNSDIKKMFRGGSADRDEFTRVYQEVAEDL